MHGQLEQVFSKLSKPGSSYRDLGDAPAPCGMTQVPIRRSHSWISFSAATQSTTSKPLAPSDHSVLVVGSLTDQVV